MPLPGPRLIALGLQPVGGTNWNAPQLTNTFAAVRALNVVGLADGASTIALGRAAANDGLQGQFRYLSTSVAADDNKDVLAPNAGAGRWHRVNLQDESADSRAIHREFRTRIAPNVATLEALSFATSFTNERVSLLGYYVPGDGGAQTLFVDKADAATVRDGVTVFVAADGTRLKSVDTKTINVRQGGARGDYNKDTGAGTDDTARIQAVVNLIALGYAVRIPRGDYKLTDVVSIPTTDVHFGSLSIIAEAGSRLWQCTAGKGVMKTATGGDRTFYDCHFEGLSAQCAHSPAPIVGGTAFQFNDVSNSTFKNIYVEADTGIDGFQVGIEVTHTHVAGGYRNHWYGCRARSRSHATARALRLNTDANSNFFFGGQFQTDSGISAEATAEQSNFFGTVFEGTPTKAILINPPGGESYASILGCRFEGMTVCAVDAGGKSRITFRGNSYTVGIPDLVLNPGDFCEIQVNDLDGANGYDMQKTTRGNQVISGGNMQVRGGNDSAAYGFLAMRAADNTPAWIMSAAGIHHKNTGGVDLIRLELVNGDGTLGFGAGKVALKNPHIGADNSSPRLFTGNGSPEGVISAIRGSLYTRADGGAGSTLYVKESGDAAVGWVAK